MKTTEKIAHDVITDNYGDLDGLAVELRARQLQVNDVVSLVTAAIETHRQPQLELHGLFREMAEHLDYCGYGDNWERSLATGTKLPARVNAMLARLATDDTSAAQETNDEDH